MTVRELYERIGADYENVLGRLASDRLVTKFVIKFLDDGTVEDLKSAVANGDRMRIFQAAHTLKGVAANLGFSVMLDKSVIITEETRDVADKLPDMTKVRQAFDELYGSYAETVLAIREFAAAQ